MLFASAIQRYNHYGRLLVTVVVSVERKEVGEGHGILPLSTSSHEVWGAEKYLTSSGGARKKYLRKQIQIPN